MSVPASVLNLLVFKPFPYPPIKNGERFTPEHKAAEELIEPGTVLIMGDREIVLVGDCNEQFGVCDDCCHYTISDVIAYASLWDVAPQK